MKKIFSLAIILFCGISSFSQTNTWDGSSSNNWNTAANWSLNLVPTAAHDVVIDINATISVNVTPPNLKSLTISNNSTVTFTSSGGNRVITISNTGTGFNINLGSSLTITGANPGGGTTMGIAFAGAASSSTIAGSLTLSTSNTNGSSYNATNSLTNVSGTITNNNSSSTITSTAANLNFNSGGTYVHALNGGTIPTATWNAASNCNITGITSSVPAGLTQSFGNFTWNSAGHTATINLNSALTTINGNFTINQAGNVGGVRLTDPLVLSFNTGLTLNVAGNMTVSNTGAAVWLAMTNGTATVTINVGGNFNMSNAVTFFDYNIGASQSSALIVNVTGNYTQSDGFLDWAFTPTTGSVASELRLAGNFSLSGPGIISISIVNTASSVPNGKITFNKTGTQTISAATPTNLAFTDFDINSGSTLELLTNLYLYSNINTPIWGADFTVKTGAVLDMSTFQLLSLSPTSFNNVFTLQTGAHLITAHANGVQNGITGSIYDLIVTRTFSSGANYTYDGTAIQNSGIFTTTPTANQVNNLTVNNTAGNTTTGVTLQQAFAVANILTLTSGHITSTSTNLLTMNAGSNVSGQNYAARTPGGSFDSYVNGPMRKIGMTNFLFPLGKINGGNHFCGISSPANVTDSYTAEYIRSSATLLGPISVVGLDHVSNCDYWEITTTAASPNTDVTLSWNGNSNCNNAVYVDDLATLVAAHFDGSFWDSFGGFFDVGSTTGNGSLTWNGVTTFSPFSLGSTDPLTNPLPVKLVNVRAYRSGDRNKIEWTNLTETDVVAYLVERSVNGMQFVTLSTVSPRSNANDKVDYLEYDPQVSPVTYYRIKVISSGGRISYSPVVKVVAGSQLNSELTVYPNPVTGKQFTLQMNSPAGNYFVRIYTANGQLIKTEALNFPGGSYSKTIELPGQLQAGLYLLQVTGGGKIFTSKLIIQ